jgi:hypothetical protein
VGVTNGYDDLLTVGAWGADINRFDGTTYKIAECYKREETPQNLRSPKIRVSCDRKTGSPQHLNRGSLTSKDLPCTVKAIPPPSFRPIPENARETRAGRVRLAMLAEHPDLHELKTAAALALLACSSR